MWSAFRISLERIYERSFGISHFQSRKMSSIATLPGPDLMLTQNKRPDPAVEKSADKMSLEPSLLRLFLHSDP